MCALNQNLHSPKKKRGGNVILPKIVLEKRQEPINPRYMSVIFRIWPHEKNNQIFGKWLTTSLPAGP